MKRIFLFTGVLALLSGVSMAQPGSASQIPAGLSREILTEPFGGDGSSSKAVKSISKGATQVYFSEDFSNGFAGQGANGTWTTDGPNGNLWFHTFPLGATNGYNPNAPLPEPLQAVYGLFLPNYFGSQVTIPSVTAANGFLMMDADRWNSTKLNPTDPASANTTSNPITAFLVSPVIDLSAALGQATILTFAQRWRMCCNDYKLIVEVSLDGGATWITGTELDVYAQNSGQGNLIVEGLSILDMGTITSTATDLSNFRMRFVWDDLGNNTNPGQTPSHYYFMIDDIEISAAPENELVIGQTFINNYHSVADDAPDVEYVNAFEYWDQPVYVKRPFNFGAAVSNNGSAAQTNVVLTVEFEDPSANIQIFTSNPITLPPGASDTISIENVVPTSWENPVDGTYTARFSISQDQVDQFPDNNIGVNRTTRINAATPGAIFQNDRNAFTTLYPTLGQDVIFANRFAYSASEASNIAIVGIDYVLSGSTNGPSQVGEVFYLNVRKGSVFEAEGPENEMLRFFEDDELETVVEDGTLSAGATLNWISYTLPSPVFIDPNTIYQGEIQVPAAGGNVVIPAASNLQEPGCSSLYDFAEPSAGPQGWFSLGANAVMIRFRTEIISNVSDISTEKTVRIAQNYPNPFVDETRIQYQLLESGDVRFEVHDVAGRLVHAENLGQRSAMDANIHTFQRGNLESGVYTYSIISNGNRVTRKMVID